MFALVLVGAEVTWSLAFAYVNVASFSAAVHFAGPEVTFPRSNLLVVEVAFVAAVKCCWPSKLPTKSLFPPHLGCPIETAPVATSSAGAVEVSSYAAAFSFLLVQTVPVATSSAGAVEAAPSSTATAVVDASAATPPKPSRRLLRQVCLPSLCPPLDLPSTLLVRCLHSAFLV
ncbi:hypothetical protein M758_UG249600 [Ceratodon purpureus]|nr:hypothetical protein M758_UG249600 [Ceratodon purpureus]